MIRLADDKKPPARRGDSERQTGLVLDERTRTKKPPMYKVLLHNDDYTTREFVVWVLQTVFHKDESDAIAIMSHVHNNGVGVAGVYTFEVAETEGHQDDARSRRRSSFRCSCRSSPRTNPTNRVVPASDHRGLHFGRPCCHPSCKPPSSAPSTTSAAAATST